MEADGDVETTTEDSSLDVTDLTTSDLSDLSSATNQGLALLQKLQQLKVSILSISSEEKNPSNIFKTTYLNIVSVLFIL